MKLLYAPSTKSAPTAASERLRIKARAFSKRLSSRTSVAAREGPAFVRKVDVFWVNGIELTKTWGINVWAAEPADFEYSEQMRDSTGKFAPNPDEHSAKTKLGVVPEEGKGHGVVALERIREGREACKVIGAVSL